jgi:hypothetical protein
MQESPYTVWEEMSSADSVIQFVVLFVDKTSGIALWRHKWLQITYLLSKGNKNWHQDSSAYVNVKAKDFRAFYSRFFLKISTEHTS